jgi:hypothetical protein
MLCLSDLEVTLPLLRQRALIWGGPKRISGRGETACGTCKIIETITISNSRNAKSPGSLRAH